MPHSTRFVRSTAAGVVAVMTAALLAACGSSSGTTTQSGTSGGAAPETQGSASTSATDLKLIIQPGPEGQAMTAVAKAYDKAEGKSAGINVTVDQLSRTDTYAKEATLMTTKSPDYDFYQTASYYIAQHAPYLEPLTIDSSPYFKSSVSALTVDNKLYAVPMDPSVNMLFYRTDYIKDMLANPAKYGQISQQVLGKKMTPKQPSEWSWDDYIAAAAYFTKKYNPDSPTKYGTALQAKNLVYNAMIWDDVLWSFGGNIAKDNQATLDSDAAQKAMQVYRTIYTKGLTSPDSAQAEFPQTQAALTSGDAAFAVQWNAGYDPLNDAKQSPKTAGKIGIARVPGSGHLSHVHILGIGINKYSKHPEQAQEFAKYLATPAAMKIYVQAGGLASMPSVLDGSDNAGIQQLTKILKDGTFSEPALPQLFNILTTMASDLSGAWVGSGDISDALSKANSDVSKLLGK